MKSRRLRIALYSHDAQGLGHIRRNLAVAGALSRLEPRPDVLLLTGATEAGMLPRPPGCDLVTLPAIAKEADGRYRSRNLATPLPELTGLRAQILQATLDAFAPDLLLVDKHPRGFRGELEPALESLAATGGTKVVLGLRDVLDEPRVARREWLSDQAPEALERWYDAVWVYGDPRVHDVLSVLRMPDSVSARYTGYLALGRLPGADYTHRAPRQPYVLGLVGGGQDGGPLASALVSATLPPGVRAAVVLGPHMPAAERERVRALAADRPEVWVVDFLDDPGSLLDGAAAVVTMGGYNSVCEVLARGVPSLVVPRVRPRREQLVRAAGLERLGALDAVHPDDLDTGRLEAWLRVAVTRPRQVPSGIDLQGLARIPRLAREILPAGQSAEREAGQNAARSRVAI